MPPRKTDSRARAISTASDLFRKQGYHGTGLTQIIEESGSPKGSFYFHFPGGKEELAVEAVNLGSRDIVELLSDAAERCGEDGIKFVELATKNVSQWLVDSEFENACPVTSVALEMAPHSETLAEACTQAFKEWISIVERAFISCGIGRKQARSLATTFVSSLEGAFVLARTEQSEQAFKAVKKVFQLMVNQELSTRAAEVNDPTDRSA